MMGKGMRALGLLGMVALSGGVAPLSAQAASQRSRLVQDIDETTLTVDYGRPLARGRSPIFGGVVHWDEVWTPGANQSTTLEIDGPITLNGHELAEGKYSMWMVPSEEGPWEVVIDPDATRFHTEKPECEDEQLRFEVEPVEGMMADALSFTVPTLGPTSATLRMHWGTKMVSMAIETPITYSVTVDPEDVWALVGNYEMHWTPEVLEERGRPDNAVIVEISLDGDRLLMQASNWPAPYGQILLPLSDGVFNPGTLINGIMSGATLDSFYEFTFDGDEVTGFQIRNDEDRLMRVGTRVDN